MSRVAEQPSRRVATGDTSQLSQPSRQYSVPFVGGYLKPVVELGPAGWTTVADNASPLTGSTRADELSSTADRIVAPVVPLPRHPTAAHLKVLQHWEGVVEAVHEDAFATRLYDRRRPGRPEEAEFPMSDVADGDLGLVVVDAVFYWTIGYLVTAGGQRTRTSTIRFRRLPVWTAQELEDARARAEALARLLDWS